MHSAKQVQVAFPVNLTPGRNVQHVQSSLNHFKSALKSTSHDRQVGEASKYDVSVLENIAFCWFFCQHNTVFVVKNTDVRENLGQASHRFGPSNGCVSSSQIRIVPFDCKIFWSGDSNTKVFLSYVADRVCFFWHEASLPR